MEAKGKAPKNDRWKAKYKEPVEPETSDLPELPEGWVWATVESLSIKVTDGVHKKPSYVTEGIPFVTVKNLTAGHGISFEKLNFVTPEDHAQFCKRTHPERGDILISKDGTLGVVRLIETDRVFSIFVSVALVKPVSYDLSRYLVTAFESPVKLDSDSVRVGETHVHQALREALVNALAHADHEAPQGIVVTKRPDAFVFRNAGRLRVPVERLYEGGISDPRNPSLQKMFQMLGLGEKSGSGFPKILRAWREQHWLIPLISEALDLEMTTLTLPLASLIPEAVEQELRELVGDAYAQLPELDRIILLLAHRFGEIGNTDVQPYCREHPRDIGVHLKSLVDHGWLNRSGQARGTRYRLPGHLETGQLFPAAEPVPEVSEQKMLDSEQKGVDSEQYAELLVMAAPIREKGRADKALVRETIVSLCAGRFLSLRTLAELLNREPDSVRNHYITPMLREGLIRARFPEHPNHPQQAYSAVDETGAPK